MAKDLTNGSAAPTEPEIVTIRQSAKSYGHEHPRCPVRPQFLLAYNPGRWTVKGGCVVPDLHRLALTPGLNNVTVDSDGDWRLAALHERCARLGRKVIPLEHGPGGSYLRRYRTFKNNRLQPTYFDAWTRVHAGDSRVTYDLEGYVQWVRGLMASGVIPSPPHYIVRRLHADRAHALKRAELALERDASAEKIATVERLRTDLAALTELLERDAPEVDGEVAADLAPDEKPAKRKR